MTEDTDLPKSLVKRLVKAKLAELEAADARQDKRALQLNKVCDGRHVTDVGRDRIVPHMHLSDICRWSEPA